MASTKLAIGPAATMTPRFQAGRPVKVDPAGSIAGGMAVTAGVSALPVSSWNLTYPPSGTAAKRHRVPRLSMMWAISGPKPTENASMRAPQNRPAMKCPSSWKKTTSTRMKTYPTTVDK